MKISFSLLEEIADSVEGSAYPNYSGRGMYGKECVGIVLSDLKALSLGAALDDLVDDQELLAELLENFHTDSMGLQTIIYWQRVTCED